MAASIDTADTVNNKLGHFRFGKGHNTTLRGREKRAGNMGGLVSVATAYNTNTLRPNDEVANHLLMITTQFNFKCRSLTNDHRSAHEILGPMPNKIGSMESVKPHHQSKTDIQ